MFSFVGDSVLDPFTGTGTTNLAAMMTGRNSIGVEIDPKYLDMARRRIESQGANLFRKCKITAER
jgi:DNA modification methylase